jgi:hypothetical protein
LSGSCGVAGCRRLPLRRPGRRRERKRLAGASVVVAAVQAVRISRAAVLEELLRLSLIVEVRAVAVLGARRRSYGHEREDKGEGGYYVSNGFSQTGLMRDEDRRESIRTRNRESRKY